MKKQIVVDIPFNLDFRQHAALDNYTRAAFNRSFAISQTKDWIDYRIGIFMKYTGVSLMNQTSQNFVALLRYNEPTEPLIQAALANYPKLPSNIIFTCHGDEIIKQLMVDKDYLYHVNIDSDNMYRSDFIERVDNSRYTEGLECILCQDGFIYDTRSNRLAMFHHPSPSFYARIYKKDEYEEKLKQCLFEIHWNAARYNHKVLKDYNYCIIIHEKNVDNKFDDIVQWLRGTYIVEQVQINHFLSTWKISP